MADLGTSHNTFVGKTVAAFWEDGGQTLTIQMQDGVLQGAGNTFGSAVSIKSTGITGSSTISLGNGTATSLMNSVFQGNVAYGDVRYVRLSANSQADWIEVDLGTTYDMSDPGFELEVTQIQIQLA